LFKTAHKSTIAVNIFIFVVLGFYVPMQFAKIFVCTPIPAYWDRAPYPNATCLDMRVIYLSDTIMSTVTDLAVLIVPIPLVWGARMPLRMKLRAIGMLAAGGLAVVASITRVVFVRQIWETHNGTLYGAAFNLFGLVKIRYAPSERRCAFNLLIFLQSGGDFHWSDLRLPPLDKHFSGPPWRAKRIDNGQFNRACC